MYLALMLAFSVVFNQTAETSLRAQADEETTLVLRNAGSISTADYQSLKATTEKAKALQYHLDDPWLTRVLWRTGDVLTFRFGNATTLKSSSGDRSVLALIGEALPNTLFLFASEAALVLLLGGLVGLWATRRPQGPFDKALSVIPMVLNGFPTWWVGMLALMAFAYGLPLFPSGGVHVNPAPTGWPGVGDYLWHMALPLLVLVSLNLWNVAWQVRNLVMGNLNSNAVTAARARGLSERRILFVHVLVTIRPAVLTLVVMGLLQSLSGNLLIEGIFNWPGLGKLYFAAVQQSDVPVLLGVLALQTFLNLVGLVFLDLAYGWMDPRIRVGART
jgi:peptide/nickel transport system permease protein